MGIDPETLDHRQPGTRMRAKKLKMPGGNISVDAVKDDWAEMTQSGKLFLGEPCTP